MRTLSTALAGALLLAACGGGSYGSATSPMNLPSAPGESALNAYVQAGHQTSLSASNSGTSYTLQVNEAPNTGTTTFHGTVNAYSTVRTVTINKNGTFFAGGITTDYFLLNPFVPLGTIYGPGTPYAVVTSSFPLPTTIAVGNSGAFANLNAYHDSVSTTVEADITETYSVKANNSTTLLLCLDSAIANVTPQGSADGFVAGTETDCYTVDASGNAALVSVTVTAGGVTLDFM